MARLNYQRLAQQQRLDNSNRVSNRNSYAYETEQRNRHIWLLGKYKGKKMTDLPLDYLIWASENLGEDNYHKVKADVELIRRHNSLTHKVGRPDNNTAVKKPNNKTLGHVTR
jgi:hypothetical protein